MGRKASEAIEGGLGDGGAPGGEVGWGGGGGLVEEAEAGGIGAGVLGRWAWCGFLSRVPAVLGLFGAGF